MITKLPVGTHVRHADGVCGVVVRHVAAIQGGQLALVRWDDLSQTRGGSDVTVIAAPAPRKGENQ
jgi:hypothetical protein